MKKYILYTLAAVGMMGLTTSCSDFGDTNIDPEHSNPGNMKYEMMFTQAQNMALGSDWDVWRNGLIYCGNMMQHVTSVNWSYGVFYTYSDGYNSAFWEALYSGDRGAVRDIIHVMKNWEGKEGYENNYQYARILKAYIFHRMTDLYGDIPYSEAGRPESYLYPKYDKQEDIYMDLLKELEEAQAAIDESKVSKIGAADMFYAGDAKQWKKFANSLMLRVAMRIKEVKPDVAEQYVKKAVANGVILDAADNAIIKRDEAVVTNDSAEPYGKILSNEDAGKFFISESFFNLLKNDLKDPRLALYCTKCQDPTKPYNNTAEYQLGDMTLENQNPMPIGYTTAQTEGYNLSEAPGAPVKEDGTLADDWRSYYSTVNRLTYGNPQSPTFVITNTENLLLLAEAALEGWVTDKSASDYYREGVTAAMKQFSYFKKASDLYDQYITDAAISEYLTVNALSGDKETAIKQIATQYYIATFCDEYETFANWRRTGYPELKSVWEMPHATKPYPSQHLTEIPRRFTYLISEQTGNTANYNEAIERQGLSGGYTDMGVRMWWDVKGAK